MAIVVQDTAAGDETDAALTVPVLALPLRMTGHSLATVAQGGTAELAQSVGLLLSTRPGERLATLGYGTPDLAFRPDITPAELAGACAEWEPRVSVTVTVDRTDPAHPIVHADIGPADDDTDPEA